MPTESPLKPRFVDAVRTRGIPSAALSGYIGVVDDLAEYLGSPPSGWRAGDLERFMVERLPELDGEGRGRYGTALGILTEVLEEARTRGELLVLESAARREDSMEFGLLDLTESSTRDDDPMAAFGAAGTHMGEEPPNAAEAPRGSDPPAKAGESDFGLLSFHANDASDPSADPIDSVDSSDSGFDLIDFGASDAGVDEALEMEPPSQPPVDDEVPVGFTSLDDELVLEDSDAESVVSSGQIEVRPSLRGTSPVPANQESIRQLEGWTSAYRIEPQPGEVLLDGRYAIPLPIPLAERFEIRRARVPSAVEQFTAAHRPAVIAASASFLIALVLLVLLPPLGLLALVGALMLLGAAGLMFVGVREVASGPESATDDLMAAREYLAAVRVGLYHRARMFLAYPREAAAVEMAELSPHTRAAKRDLEGRFNTLSPAMLQTYWSPRVALLDEPGDPHWARLRARFTHPDAVHLERVLKREGASVILCRLGTDAYLYLPTARIGDSWYVTNGACLRRSARVELMRRLARKHANGRLDDEGLEEAFRRHNLTRADVTRGRLGDVLSERQASFLVRRALASESGRTASVDPSSLD